MFFLCIRWLRPWCKVVKKRNLKIELSLNYQKRVQTVEFKRIFLDLVEDKKRKWDKPIPQESNRKIGGKLRILDYDFVRTFSLFL